jgi:hypothetical protein
MTTAPKKYSFQTIVVPAQVRVEFTHVREDLMTTDKMLSQALWNIAMRDADAVRQEVSDLKEVAAQLKVVGQITRGEVEGAVPKAAKLKRVTKVPQAMLVSGEQDMDVLVVNGL